MKERNFDLHIHSVLSPCGSLRMSPKAIAQKASDRGMDVIAITDHNSAKNQQALHDYLLSNEELEVDLLYGLEAQTEEEVHVVCLFDTLGKVREFGDFIYSKLPEVPNDEDFFGAQIIVDENEEVLGTEKLLLANSLELSIEKLCGEVEDRGGLTFPSHVLRPGYGIIEQLGFIPESLVQYFPAVEVSAGNWIKANEGCFGQLSEFSRVCFSDAHHLEDIGNCFTKIRTRGLSVQELKRAFLGQDGRGIVGTSIEKGD